MQYNDEIRTIGSKRLKINTNINWHKTKMQIKHKDILNINVRIFISCHAHTYVI